MCFVFYLISIQLFVLPIMAWTIECHAMATSWLTLFLAGWQPLFE